MTEPDDADEIRDESDKCHWCSKEAKCNHCGEYVTEDENYQFSGGDSYLCESCGNKPGCAGCDSIIDDDVVSVDGQDYHEACVPDTDG